MNKDTVMANKKYLELLSDSYSTIQEASTEIINLTAILNLPKGTEHFITDLHGEYDVFTHILKNASGSVKRKIDRCFGDEIDEQAKNDLATLIYYPEQKLADCKRRKLCDNAWYRATLVNLVRVCRVVTSKYTRSKVRKALPEEFRYIIEELMYTDNFEVNKQEYFNNILDMIIETDSADNFIVELSALLHRLVIDRLHIIGDIFDRGTGAHLIMEDLCNHRNVDFQWGNHDVVWMAASQGHAASIANVVRNSIRYNNFNSLEDGYGINIRPLALFAMECYRDDPCTFFKPKALTDDAPDLEAQINFAYATKVHKAITVIQMKLEGQIILSRPEFKMQDRLLLGAIDHQNGTVVIEGQTYELNDTNFPTVDPEHPYTLTPEEQLVVEQLRQSFLHSKLLRKHVDYLYQKGGIYGIFNNNLMYHGCIPMREEGAFDSLFIDGVEYSGKALTDECDRLCRIGGYGIGEAKEFGLDFMWYLWCGNNSPLNGKKKMTTFERAFVSDTTTHEEPKDYYYEHIKHRPTAELILREFGITAKCSHIVNGHVPVKIVKGESPIKAGGKLLIIDGGIARAYQKVTGISGYTLISNSYQLLLSEHQPFKGVEAVIKHNDDMHSKNIVVENYDHRLKISDTDNGAVISKKIKDLKMLLYAYRTGAVTQHKD